MEDSIETIRAELRKYNNYLKNDIEEFSTKLNLTRKNVFDYIDRQIEYLANIKKEYEKEFDYLDEENKKTCRDNRQQFDNLCLLINQNDRDLTIVSKLSKDFKKNFSLRPTMLKSIPEYHFKDIHINNFIQKSSSTPVNDSNSSSIQPTTNHIESPIVLRTNHTKSPAENKQSAFVPINHTQRSSKPTGSIGSSHHKQFASQNNETDFEPQSRLVSSYSTIPESDNTVDVSFKIPYEHERSPCLISFNVDENYLLSYVLSSHRLEHLSLNSRQISPVDLPFSESILNLGYSIKYCSFYVSTRYKHRFLLFRLNQEKRIEIDREIDLIQEKEHFISVHIYENFIFFLYLSSSSIVMFGKYDLDKSSFFPPISFQSKLYDIQEQSPYKIIDFTMNSSYINFLAQLTKKPKFLIIVHEYDTLVKLHSFELIDANRPVSIVSIENRKSKSATTKRDNQIELLLFINDPRSHSIHCCNCEQYLLPIQVNVFGMCSLDNGNIALVGSNDIRGLKIRDHLQRNSLI